MNATPAGLSGRHFVVAGASRGIGAAIALELAAHGCVLTLLGRNAARLDAVVDAARRAGAAGARAQVLDLVDGDAVLRAAADWDRGRAIYGLVHCAGAAESGAFIDTGEEIWRRMLDVNLMTAVHVTRAILPALQRAGGGRIVYVASTAGLTGYPYVSAYTAAKHALVGLTRSLALETARHGIAVNAVCPGYTDTEMLAESVARVSARTGKPAAEVRSAYAAANAQGRLIAPGEVARAVIRLCDPAQPAATGQAQTIEGDILK